MLRSPEQLAVPQPGGLSVPEKLAGLLCWGGSAAGGALAELDSQSGEDIRERVAWRARREQGGGKSGRAATWGRPSPSESRGGGGRQGASTGDNLDGFIPLM